MILRALVVLSTLSISLFAMGPSLVHTTKLVKGEVNPLQEFIGTVSFNTKSVLAAQNSGIVEKINFEVGDKVSKGKSLVQIDADLLNAQINSARANEKNKKKDFERYTNLLDKKTISQKEYDDVKLSYITAKSILEELQVQSDKKNIKAPYRGVVVDKKVNLGEWVNAGTPLLSMVNTSVADINFSVPVGVANGLKKGDTYDVIVGDKTLKAKLNAVIPSGDKLTRTFPVKFKANTQGKFIFDGQEAKVSLSKNAKQESLILPRDAVIKRFGQNVVFAVTAKNTVAMIPVQVIGYVSNKVAVAGKGLVIGMDIVVKGNERVFPNSPVKVLNK